MDSDSTGTVLIFEDAEGVAANHARLLQGSFSPRTCSNGKAANALIREGLKFDVAIMDIVAPAETDGATLAACQDTGLRLIQGMIEHDTCRRFYVITVRADLEAKVQTICGQKAAYRFEHKLDHEPGRLLQNVRALLATNL